MPESPVVEVSPTKMNDIEITIATNLPDDSKDVEKEVVSEPPAFKHTWSVWSIFLVLCLFSFLSGLDGTIVTTSLPTIIREIGGGEQLYLWTAQSFFFSSTAPQPLFGQIANVFGRRNPFLVTIALFALGSGLSGGATSAAMLIVGRIVQGLGAGGLYVLSDIIICDIVPPRHRGPYLSVVVSTAGIGATIGPVVGGALADSNWRWVFYLNLPISILGFIVMILLLKVKHKRNPTWLYALKRVDFLGAFIFIPSMISLFLGLITGGIQQPWSSWRTILPLILGVFGWLLYHFHQATPSLCPFPSTPPRLFTNRTSVIGFLLIFLSSIILQSIAYFLPLYFQAVKLVSPLLSGVYYLPFALAIIPFAGSAGFLLSKYGRYIPLHYCGFALLVLGSGLLSTLTVQSSRAAWIGFQIIPSAGIALVFTATMPSTLVALEEADVAVATATYSFVRSFGFVWGVTIAGVVFNGQVDTYLYLVKDEGVRGLLRGGAAYAFAASGEGIKGLADESTKGQVIEVYARALRVIWLVVMTIALVGLLCIPVERRIDLRKSHVTEFGLEEEN
ncbi:hypothetical protein G7Y89_g7090 [Cudoniella acicularis]|uniref:Major facilitator superfamily (MFS) profile domain-containing protein n=1 Tax=Cudoniella acicularis TaxID=354080 RepID=A0A8H4RMQ0_9HELO|nr:hypothetical protein G7Y89_g7090 [Cudoniella acicularis]